MNEQHSLIWLLCLVFICEPFCESVFCSHNSPETIFFTDISDFLFAKSDGILLPVSFFLSLSIICNSCWLLLLWGTFSPLPSWDCCLPRFSSLGLSFSVLLFDSSPQMFCQVLSSNYSNLTLSLIIFITNCGFCYYLYITGSEICISQDLPSSRSTLFCL